MAVPERWMTLPGAAAKAAACGERLAATMNTAEALIQAHRRVDLQGLDQQADEFCRMVLALSPEHRRAVEPMVSGLLAALVAGVDRLRAVLEQAATPGRPQAAAKAGPAQEPD